MNRSLQQKIGARGHKWLVARIEEHPAWLVRELGEDYGVDIEAELAEQGVRGEILKIQIKSSTRVERRNGRVKLVLERRYLEYADCCRYPVIVVLVDVQTKQAWFLRLQDRLLHIRGTGSLDSDQSKWTTWIPEEQSIESGLDGELKSIAAWKGETQLVLSLIDALHAAASTCDETNRVVEAQETPQAADDVSEAVPTTSFGLTAQEGLDLWKLQGRDGRPRSLKTDKFQESCHATPVAGYGLPGKPTHSLEIISISYQLTFHSRGRFGDEYHTINLLQKSLHLPNRGPH